MMNRANRRKLQGMKRTALILCLMLAVCVASVGGTIAWLTAKTAPVTNTFTAAGIDISLVETKQSDGNELGTNGTWSAQLLPGKTYTKDPVVAVDGTKTDVDVYLFVKAEVSNNTLKVGETDVTKVNFTLTMDATNSGWTKGDGTNIPADVYYRVVKTTDPSKSWNLITDDKVTVNSDLTKDQTKTNLPVIKFTAYAIQQEGFTTAEAAWDEVSKLDNNTNP